MTVVEPFVTQLGIDYTILFANDQVLKAYDIAALPTAVVIDRQGNIRRRFEGAEGSKRTYEHEVKKWFLTNWLRLVDSLFFCSSTCFLVSLAVRGR